MFHADIYESAHEVNSKLSEFGVTRRELIAIALQAVAARNNATPLHPINAPGTYSYMEGVAGLREIFLGKEGWGSARPNGLEAVTNKESNLTIVFQNVDRACSESHPQPISGKGEGAKRLVENPTAYLFDYMADEDRRKENQSVWFLCVSVNGEELRVELSLPGSIDEKLFSSFMERIFIITDDEWTHDPDDSGTPDNQDYDIQVTRK